MYRRLFNIAVILSPMLILATVALWVRSYSYPCDMSLGAPLHNGSLETGSEWAWRISSANGTLKIDPVCSFYSWSIPYWKLIAVWLIVPAYSAWHWIQRWRISRKPRGFCQSCGYDMCATPDR